ncbi:hypothetical protein, partial [Listeria monocytogenes]|uniref:hypothetical protein n=1 Tax=Listeria monocytogenes TaxID=1639 RepID=UPI001C54B9A5
MKLPLALSGRNTLKSEHVAGAICSMWPPQQVPVKGIHRESGRLADAHLPGLAFLEIGHYPQR